MRATSGSELLAELVDEATTLDVLVAEEDAIITTEDDDEERAMLDAIELDTADTTAALLELRTELDATGVEEAELDAGETSNAG